VRRPDELVTRAAGDNASDLPEAASTAQQTMEKVLARASEMRLLMHQDEPRLTGEVVITASRG
jgi:hypothetical protein